MDVIDLSLPGLKLIRPDVFGDSRGFFLETYHAERYAAAGIAVPFVQDNHSRSVKNTLRGLHYQSQPGQAKLIRVVLGRVWDVAVDIRPRSPTFGQWHGLHLDAERHEQLFIPVGFAHGFCVLSDIAEVEYKCSDFYDRADEIGARWDSAGIEWPIKDPLLSPKDAALPTLLELRKTLGS